MKKMQFLGSVLGICLVSASVFFTSCKKEEATLPPIGGYNNADEVGSANLMAYWPMNGDGKESKSGSAPTKTVGATFATGKKGQAVNFSNGYLAYGNIANLASSLPSCTVSAWVNIANNGSTPSCIFTLTRPNEWAGNLTLMAETGWKKAGIDTLVVKGLVVTKVNGNDSWQDSRNEPSKAGVQANKIGGTWAHVVMTWDGATSMFKVYSNGTKISNPEWEQRGTTGNLSFTLPTAAVIGTWGNVAAGGTADAWQKPMNGMVDEVRVWNKSLSDSDISALFQLEGAGR